MGFTAALIGGVSGTCIHLMTNAVKKIPLSRAPWNHVGYFLIGGWIGTKYVALEYKLLNDINEIRADKGMPPMVGTNAYIKYVPAGEGHADVQGQVE